MSASSHVLRLRLCFALALGALVSCDSPPAPPPGSDWARRQYLEKVAHALRGGGGLQEKDYAFPLMVMSNEQVVEHFMRDERFTDTVLDFNLYFLGLKRNSVRGAFGELNFEALVSRRAIHSALEVAQGGDYLTLLGSDHPMYLALAPPPRFPPAPPVDAGTPDAGKADAGSPDGGSLDGGAVDAGTALASIVDAGVPFDENAASDVALRAQRLKVALEAGDELIRLLQTGAPMETFCSKLSKGPFLQLTFGLGFDPNTALALLLSDKSAGSLTLGCGGSFDYAFDRVAAIRAVQARYKVLAQFVETNAPTDFVFPTQLRELLQVNASSLGLQREFGAFDFLGFYQLAANSSTNRSRRRSAYMLQRFFCDDLKPVNAALPAAHAGSQHASDPACMACHYKLDPMAGFFRFNGFLGWDFGSDTQIVFDDMATLKRTDYEAPWLAPENAGHEWNIGYIRSSTDSKLNTYGRTLDDLGQILQTAPEVKACLVRRAFEYFNGSEQLVDPGYLADLTEKFTQEAAVNSTDAFKALVRRILTSKTFLQTDPHSDQCYDLAPGSSGGASRPPCSVAYTLAKNCAACHTGTAGQGALDLTGWTQDANGVATFPHLSQGVQLPAAETLRRVLDRISTSDPARVMPLGQSMPARDREALYLWFDQRLQSGGVK